MCNVGRMYCTHVQRTNDICIRVQNEAVNGCQIKFEDTFIKDVLDFLSCTSSVFGFKVRKKC